MKTNYQLKSLYDFITANFGLPQYDATKDKSASLDKYEQLFAVRNATEKPIIIWQTEKNNIVLLASVDFYYIHAEQIK